MKRSNEESLEIQFHKRSKFTSFPSMDYIINNPGLQNIIEVIFLNLDFEELLACQLINKSCQKILDNPMFWLKKWILRGLSKKNQENWTKAVLLLRNTNLKGNLNFWQNNPMLGRTSNCWQKDKICQCQC